MSAFVNRRGILGLFAATAPAMALAAPSAAKALSVNDRFLLTMEAIHPDGRKAAQHALNAGMRPDQLYSIVTFRRENEHWPALLFDTGNGIHTFRPIREDRR